MNRIDKTLHQKNDILSIYFTAGYPELKDTLPVVQMLEENGIDMVEIGMPFSDPVADGPVIQEASQQALKQGMSLKVLFEQLETLREKVSIPVILMGYLNPVLSMGMGTFLRHCAEVGIDGIILPDLPPEEYEASYQSMFRQQKIHNILLVTPQTPEERVRKLASLSGGFLYLVSSYATTGEKKGFGEEQLSYLKRIQDMRLSVPGIVGFGIHDQSTFRDACRYAHGAIIGTAFIRALQSPGTLQGKINRFIKTL